MRLGGTIAGWLLTAAAMALLLIQRYREAVAPSTSQGYDFLNFFQPAALAVWQGDSPYLVYRYSYSPLFAILIAPLGPRDDALTLWTGVSIASAAAALALFALLALRTTGAGVRLAGVTGFAAVTLLWSWPVTVDLFLGQTQLFALAVLMLVAVLAERHRHHVAGAVIVFAALVKTWPVAVGLWVLRSDRPWRDRLRTLGVMTATMLAAAAAFAVLFGPSSLADWAEVTVNAREQYVATFSVWAMNRHVFGSTPNVDPVTVSAAVGVGAALILAALIVLALVLRRPGAPALAMWHVALAAVMLLPTNHLTYFVVGLPIGWTWAARLVSGDRVRVSAAVVAAFTVWWFVAFRVQWPGDSMTTTSSTALLAIVPSTVALLLLSVALEARTPQPTSPASAGASSSVQRNVPSES